MAIYRKFDISNQLQPISSHLNSSDRLDLPSPTTSITQLVAIAAQVEDIDTLIKGVVPGATVVVLDATQDGVAQITQAIHSAPSSIDSVHIVSHGSPGCLYLGNSQFSLDTLEHDAAQIKSWFAATVTTPQLYLYGCNVAAGDAGAEFLAKLHALTGAAISASTSRVGNSELGGNWHLDVAIGRIRHSLFLTEEAQQVYTGTFAASFTRNDYTPAGSDFRSVAIGDVTGTTAVDLVVSSVGTNSISTLAGNNSSFSQTNTSSVGNFPAGIAIADFNGNGVLDVVVADDASGTLTVWRDDFTSSISYSPGIGGNTRFVKVADFTGDGISDLVTYSPSNSVAVLPGNGSGGVGDGTFGSAITSATGLSNAFDFATGDFNEDGNVDLALSNPSGSSISVLLGNGNGTFAAPAFYSTASDSYDVAVADFNNDGILDLVTANLTANSLSVLLGNGTGGVGNGTFGAATSLSLSGRGYSVDTGDFDGDGNADIAAISIDASNVFVFSGQGDGTFSAPDTFAVASNPNNVTVGDVNADGRPDIVTSNPGSGKVTVLVNSTITNTAPVINDEKIALDLDGTNDFVDLPNLGISGNTSVSVSAWINVNDVTAENIFGFGNAGQGNRVFSFRTGGIDGQLILYFWGNDLVVSGPSFIGQWTHVAATYDSASQTQKIFVNGLEIGSRTAGTPNFVNANYRIGGFNNEYFNGSIDEVGVWNRALSSTEIQSIYNNNIETVGGTLAYYSFVDDSNASTVITDQSGNNFDGTLINGQSNHIITATSVGSPIEVSLNAVNEDAGAPTGAVGTLISDLVDLDSVAGGSDNINDPDAGAVTGLAITAANTTNGSWFFTTDGGTTWTALGAVSETNARLLAADANTRLYFQSSNNFNGDIANAITFRVWDQTSGANGDAGVDVSTNGGTTAFSAETANASITINAVNDAPTLSTTSGAPQNLTAVANLAPGSQFWDVEISGNLAFLADYVAGVQIVDISDPLNITNVSIFDTPGDAFGLSVANDIAYVADGNNGVILLDVSAPATPTPLQTVGGIGFVRDVLIEGNLLYAASGNSLSIIDVTTPASASVIGSLNLSSEVWDVHVNTTDNLAYVASFGGLRIVDISNPNSPSILGSYPTIPGEEAFGLHVVGTTVYLASNSAGLRIIDTSTPSSPTLLGTYDTPGQAREVTVVGDYAYVSDGSSGLQVLDISTPAAITLIDSVDLTSDALDTEVVGRYAFVAGYTNGLEVIDLGFPSPSLSAVNEDAAAPTGAVGTLISDLVDLDSVAGGSDNINDPDAGAATGLAITAADTTNGSWFFTTDGGTTWTALGAVSETNARLLAADANTRLYFQSSNNFNGDIANAITFRAWDQTSGTNGSSGVDTSTNGGTSAFSTNTATASITVNPVDDPAVITGDITGTGDEDTTLTGTLSAADVEGLTDGTYFSITADGANGTASIDAETGAWSYTPTANFNGTDSFTVTVTDDLGGTTTQVVNLNVNPLDDPAVITGDTNGSGDEDTTLTGTLSATDVEGLTDSTYFSVTTAASNGTATIDPASGAWSYTPTANFNGTDSFTVTVTDDLGGTTTQVVNLNVNPLDDPAVITGDITGTGDEDTTLTGTLSATDVEGLTDGTYFSITADGANGTASIDAETGAWSYVPTANFNGTDSFTVTVTDDLGGTTTQVVNLNVNPLDDPAVITGDTNGSGDEGTTLTGTLSATDVEGLTDGTYFSITADGANGTASIDPASGAWSYVPTANFNGTDSFTVTVTDDLGGTTTQVVNLNVNPLDDPAVITGDITGTGDEDTTLTGTLSATDVEGLTDGTYFSITADGANGTASIDAETGAWSYTPTANFNGTDSFTVTVTDDLGGTTTQVVNLNVNPLDDPAVITGDITGTGDEDTTLTGTLSAADVEGLTDGTYFSVTTAASNGTPTIDPASGAWSYVPTANFNGTDSFTVTVTDDLGGTTTQAIDITVNAVNDDPIGSVTISGTATQGETLTVSNTLADADGLGAITYTWLADGTTTGVTGNSYTLTQADVGKTFTVQATYTDGEGTPETITSAATDVVANANDAPTGVGIFNFEQWVSYSTIRTGSNYQSGLVDFNFEIGGLRVAPLFDETDYLSDNPDVALAVQQGVFKYGFEHFVLHGINEGRSPSNWFDEQYYLAQNADVAAAVSQGIVSSGIAHFFTFGHRENRDPSAFFDDDDYLLKNPDVKAAVDAGEFDSAFEHYIEFGAEEGRLNGLLFEEAFYLQQNPDVAAEGQTNGFTSGLYHFLSFGQSEGRDPSSLFDQSAYLARYDNVAAAVSAGAFASGFEHYLLFGRSEGRIAV